MRSLILRGKLFLSNAFARRGRRITRFPLPQYLRDFGIDCVLDVGANSGQYAMEIRGLGYRGRIESFEPLPQVFAELKSAAAGDRLWNVHDYALGSESCVRPINVSANSPSSSFLPMDSRVTTDAVDLSTVGTVDVEIKRLDEVFSDVCVAAKNVFLKIDTQGFERNVIEGATDSLRKICMVQMELALVANYQGETLIEEMIGIMRERGFVPWWLMDGFRNPRTLQLYQTDVFFVRADLSDAAR